MSNLRTWIILGSHLSLVLTSPIYTPRLLSGVGSGGTIRNLPCISTRTKETGVCMFATACERANGTHLSTCIDRYYFGSCCKLPDHPEAHPHQNTIEGEHTPRPFVITNSVEETIIRDDYSTSKTIVDDQDVSSISTVSPNTMTTKSILQQLSSTITVPQKPSITETTTIVTNVGGFSSPKPASSIDETSTKHFVTETTTKMPSSIHETKPVVTEYPMISLTPRPSSSMSSRNATTTRPIQVTTTSPISTPSTASLNNASSETITMMETTAWPQEIITTTSSPPTSNTASTLSIVSLVFNGTILTNEIPSPTKVPEIVDTDYNTLSTQYPALITWSSYVDNKVPMVSEVSSASPVENSAHNSAATESNSWLGPTVPTISSTTIPDGKVESLLIPTENFNMSDYKQVCGMRLVPESRIVGGDASTFGKWPWQISLQRWNTSSSAFEHSCGATLLTNNWAITAAHCVEAIPWKYLMLIIGEHDRSKKDEPYEHQERRVNFVFSHPQFDVGTFENDLALLRFDKPLKLFQPNIVPICLPDNDEYYVGQTGFVTGWGRLTYDGRMPSVLHEAPVPVISNTVCERMYKKAGYREHIPNIFICAGRWKGGIDSCEGDSGGPMVIQRPNDNRWILVGVISWGIGCGAPSQPGVYTRISEFREWITQSVQLIDEAYAEAEAFP